MLANLFLIASSYAIAESRIASSVLSLILAALFTSFMSSFPHNPDILMLLLRGRGHRLPWTAVHMRWLVWAPLFSGPRENRKGNP